MTPALRQAAMKSQDSVHKHPRKREGLLGTGMSGKRGTKEWNLETGANPEDQGCCGPGAVTAENNRQCPSGIAQRPPHHATAVPTAMQNRVTKKNVRSSAVGKQLKQKKSSSLSSPALYLPALDLSVWASFFVTASSSSPPSRSCAWTLLTL